MPNVITRNPPKAGELLLAEPFLMDTNFSRAVVLLSECNDDGAVGFVLNKPLNVTLKQVLPDDLGSFDAPLHFGGPVEPDTLHYIHVLGDQLDGAVEVVPGVYWGGSFEVLRLMIAGEKIHAKDLRFFAGYSGWGAGQLESEMKENSWIKTTLSPGQVFASDPDQLWKQIMINLGGRYKVMANFPVSQSLN